MKRIGILILLSTFAVTLSAQSETQTVELQEVEVKAAKVIHKPDGQTIYPTEVQKKASHSGYSILQKLSLPNIRVDEASHSLSAIDGRGSIQLRIDGIIVGREEMLSLAPERISRIDFIDNPGVRYGEGIAYVINILTRRNDSGYTVGVDLMQALTAKSGNDLIYGKWNAGKSELSLSYNFGYKDLEGNRMNETAHYLLTDGSTRTIGRNDIASRSRSLSNDLQLKYNLADSANYVFQASLNAGFSHIPHNYNCKQIVDGGERYLATQSNRNLSSSPVLDLYFFKQFSPRQSLRENVFFDERSYLREPPQAFYPHRGHELYAEIYEEPIRRRGTGAEDVVRHADQPQQDHRIYEEKDMGQAEVRIAGKKTLKRVLASVRSVKGNHPVVPRQSGLDSRCHAPTWGSSCLRAVIISLHVAPSPPRCWHA